jgi:hypothetical protein
LTIPELQLERWSHQGPTAGASAAYESVRRGLASKNSPIRDLDFEVYLQGSYKNDTNIRTDSDVDIVLQLNSTFHYDDSAMREEEKTALRRSTPQPTYSWEGFRSNTLKALKSYFDESSVTEGNKSVKLSGDSGRLPADIVVCLQFRKYRKFRSEEDHSFTEGITFRDLNENRWVVNFPKQHYERGVSKNSEEQTDGCYKPTVRLFKNARNNLIDQRVITDALAPSYFLESLIYNVPNNLFSSNLQKTLYGTLFWLTESDLSDLPCPNQQLPLFGSASEQWSLDSAKKTVGGLSELWDNWS